MKTRRPTRKPAPRLDWRTDYQAWESAQAASFGGVYRDWPPACQAIVRAHYGYLPSA